MWRSERFFFLDRPTCVGLCTYLLRTELSLDRLLRGPVAALKRYCEGPPQPGLSAVLATLSSLHPFDVSKQTLQPPRGRGVIGMVAAWVQWYLSDGVHIREAELRFIYDTLLILSDALNKHAVVEGDLFTPIRMQWRRSANLLLRCIPSPEIRDRISHVEHLNQNPILKTVSLESITKGANWLRVF